MKKLAQKSLLTALIVGAAAPAFAAVDPAFATSMNAIAADVLGYMVAALGVIGGVFGFAIAVRFGTGAIKRVAK